jgi:hypothetical protein
MATTGKPKRRATALAVSSSAAAYANHHRAIITATRQLRHVALAAMAFEQQMLRARCVKALRQERTRPSMARSP